MIKRQWIISLVVSILLLLIGGVIAQVFKAQKKSTVSESPVRQEITYVSTGHFPPQTIQSRIEVDGRLNAYEKLDLAAEVTGRLLPGSRTWRKGDAFRKGDLLFQVDSEDETFSLYAQRSNLLNAITQIMPDLKFDYPEAFKKWKSYLDAFDIESPTPSLPKVITDQEKYFIAGKNIYNLYYSIKSEEDQMKDFNVYAPFSGVFLSVNAFPGSLVSPGVTLCRIMNTGRYELETPINLKDFELIKCGQKVKLYASELNQSYEGTINRISNQIDQTTQSIPIFITVNGRGLRDGMYLHGELNGSQIDQVSVLPIESIVNQNQVYVVRDSTISEKSVEILLRSDDEVFVRGIVAEDDVIIEGLNSLSPGQRAASINN